MTNEAYVGSPTYGREMHHCTQVVKKHDQRDLLIDCCVSAINESPEVDQCQNNHNYNLTLETELNTVALKQSEPPGHGHYSFHPLD